jgi:hypothetical protein
MLLIYIRTEFHVPSSSDSLVIVIKMKRQCKYRAAAILFNILENVSLSRSSKVRRRTELKSVNPTLVIVVTSILHDRCFGILVLSNYKGFKTN